jgi:hypothetical protein
MYHHAYLSPSVVDIIGLAPCMSNSLIEQVNVRFTNNMTSAMM